MSWHVALRHRLNTPQRIGAVIVAVVLAAGAILAIANLAVTSLTNFEYLQHYLGKHPRLSHLIQGNIGNWLLFIGIFCFIVLIVMLVKLKVDPPGDLPAPTGAALPPAPKTEQGQDQPAITAVFVEDDDALFLRVTNPGPPTHFRASLHFEDTVELLRPKGSVYGVWSQAPSSNVEILSGESLDLLVAERRPYSKGHLVTGYFQWHFPYYDGADRKEIVTSGYFALNYTAEVWQDKWRRLPDDLEVVLHLELLSRALTKPLTKTVNFKGAAWSDPDAAPANTGSREAVAIGRFRESYPIITKAVVFACEDAFAAVVSGCFGDYLPQSRHSLVLAAS